MILSIDPGIRNFGIVVLELTGHIQHMDVVQSVKTKNKTVTKAGDYAACIKAIFEEITKLRGKYPLTEINAEMPVSLVAKSSSGTTSLSISVTSIVAISSFLGLPLAHRSPRQVKEGFTGNPRADKKEIMARCCEIYDWDITYKIVKQKNKPVRYDPVYHVTGEKLPAGYFEHIADAIAVAHVIQKEKLV